MKDLEKVLTEQILDMKINHILDTCEENKLPIYLSGTEKDYLQWIELLKTAISSAKVFEIHCWNEENEWIEFALKYGTLKESDWKYGKIITGEVTPEFINMLLKMPKAQDTDIFNKITPFFNIFLDDIFQSSHYGTELYMKESES